MGKAFLAPCAKLGHASLDSRCRAALAVHDSPPSKVADIARAFGVTSETVLTWHGQMLDQGYLTKAKPRVSCITRAFKRVVVRYVEQHPSSYLWEVQKHFLDTRGQHLPLSTLSRILRQAGWSKQRIEKRFRRMLQVHHFLFSSTINYFYSIGYNADRFLFCDEFSIEVSTCWRKSAWSRRGQTPLAKCSTRTNNRFSVLILCSIDGIVDWTMTDGTFDSQIFAHSMAMFSNTINTIPRRYNTHVLIADGAAIHKTDEAERVLAESGILLRFLPPYSPKLNPCEFVIGVLRKRMNDWMHRVGSASRDVFLETLQLCLASYRGYPLRDLFRHCGYHLTFFSDPYFADATQWSDDS